MTGEQTGLPGAERNRVGPVRVGQVRGEERLAGLRTPGGLAVGLAAAAAVRVAVDRGNGPAWDGLVYDVAQAAVGGGRTGPAATTPATRR